MRVKFYASQRPDKDEIKHQAYAISTALRDATKLYKDDFEVVHNATFQDIDYDVDVACIWGLMGNAPQIVSRYTARNKHVVMFDKALIRHLGAGGHGTFRVGIDGPSPIKYMMRVPRSFERFERRRIDIANRVGGQSILRPHVLYCGSSQKYCDYYDLGEANAYAENLFQQLREIAKKISIVYRPKPSWQGAREIEGTRFSGSGTTLKRELEKANLLITHGSAASVEAIVAGVPVIALGPCAARPVAGLEITNETVLDPYFPSDPARYQWLWNLAYCQWNVDELQSGEAWGFIRNEIIEMDKA